MNTSYGYDETVRGEEAIIDYVVSRNGVKMKFDDFGRISNSFDEKAGKYGVIKKVEMKLN